MECHKASDKRNAWLSMLLQIMEIHTTLTTLQITHWCTNNICEQLSLCQPDSLFMGFSCRTTKAEIGPGRPQVEVSKEQLEFLRLMHFSWSKIANILGVSLSTINRKREYWQMNDEISQWSQISDEELDNIVGEIRRLTPNIGERRLVGALRCRHIRVQRRRVRNCLMRWIQLVLLSDGDQ